MKKLIISSLLLFVSTVCFAQFSYSELRNIVVENFLRADAEFHVYYYLKSANDNYNRLNKTNEPFRFGMGREEFKFDGDRYFSLKRNHMITMSELDGHLLYEVVIFSANSRQAQYTGGDLINIIRDYTGYRGRPFGNDGIEWGPYFDGSVDYIVQVLLHVFDDIVVFSLLAPMNS